MASRLVVLTLLAALTAARADYEFALDEQSLAPHPDWTGRDKAESYGHSFADGVASFRASGKGRTMVWARHFDPPMDLKGLRYVTLRYRAENLNPELFSYLLFLSNATDGRMRADYLGATAGDLVIDGDWHVFTTELKFRDRLCSVALRFQSLPGTEGRLEVSRLALTADPPRFPIATDLDWRRGVDPAAGQPLAVAEPTTQVPALQTALALQDWFDGPDVVVEGVPFQVAVAGPAAVSTPLRELATARFPVGRPAADLYLLLGMETGYRLLTYDAWQPGDRIASSTRFTITVRYADGGTDRQVPYCLDKHGYGVWRGLHVYEVATDQRPVEEITLDDGMKTAAFHLVALTAGGRRRMPAQAETPTAASGPAPLDPTAWQAARQPGSLSYRDREVDIAAGAGTVRLRLTPNAALSAAAATVRGFDLKPVPVPLFRVREGETTWTSDDFRPAGAVSSKPDLAVARYTSDAARLEAEVSVRPGDGEALVELRVCNLAAEPRHLAVTFPEVAVTAPRDGAALRYALPRSVMVLDDSRMIYTSQYGGRYPVQWLDLYSPAGGLTVATRTREPVDRSFAGGKDDTGRGVARVEYLDNRPLPPGEWVAYPPASLALHGGDWHAALAADRRWRATWGPPLKPRIDWYRDIWHLRTHWINSLGGGKADYNWQDPATGKLRPLEFVAKDRAAFGPVDYIHLFDWRISKTYGRWGDYKHYDEIGGLPAFREALGKAQTSGIRMGLYLDCFLCSRKSECGQAHGQEWGATGENGQLRNGYGTADDPMYNMCLQVPAWRDYLAETCARVVRETGCDGIYLDEGGFILEQYNCWRTDHGHPPGGTTLAGERALFERVKTAIPQQTALYTEYCPPDIIAPYLDGAYMHALRLARPEVSPGYLNTSRFSFPDLRLFQITNGGSCYDGIWDGFYFTLFNGMRIYSLAWGHDDEAFVLLRRIRELYGEHGEAFCDPAPRPLVATLAAGLYANEFSSAKETVWTIWNDRYRTYTGDVLSVPHPAGAGYRDAWNKVDLKPRTAGGRAVLPITIGPREIGVLVQRR